LAATAIDSIWLGGAGLAAMLSFAYLAWRVNPAYVLTAAIVLSPLAGNWQAMGVPGPLAPDRILLVAAIGVVVLRDLTSPRGGQLRLEPVHWVLAAGLLYVAASAIAAGTFLQSAPFFRFLQTYGVLPFLTFLVAPVVYRHRRDRQILLVGFVGLGAYLGLTALFETIGLDALVFPKFILDPTVGTHFGRARGPFAEAVANGMALYVCGVAAAIAVATWRGRLLRAGAGCVLLLCLLGTVFTLQRSVWLAAVVATVVVVGATRELRRFALPLAGLAVSLVLGALVFIPGLAESAEARKNDQQTIWDRENANRAALNMIDARPLVGLGWGEFTQQGVNYFQLSSDYPLTHTVVHNLFLGLAAELGLVGLTLWVVGFVLGVGGAILARPPPELKLWRSALIAIVAFFLVMTNFVPPVVFPNLIVWLWAGVVWGGRRAWAPRPSPAQPRLGLAPPAQAPI
jgi:putative inorganic carbon (hco3(-)) transporter